MGGRGGGQPVGGVAQPVAGAVALRRAHGAWPLAEVLGVQGVAVQTVLFGPGGVKGERMLVPMGSPWGLQASVHSPSHGYPFCTPDYTPPHAALCSPHHPGLQATQPFSGHAPHCRLCAVSWTTHHIPEHIPHSGLHNLISDCAPHPGHPPHP